MTWEKEEERTDAGIPRYLRLVSEIVHFNIMTFSPQHLILRVLLYDYNCSYLKCAERNDVVLVNVVPTF